MHMFTCTHTSVWIHFIFLLLHWRIDKGKRFFLWKLHLHSFLLAYCLFPFTNWERRSELGWQFCYYCPWGIGVGGWSCCFSIQWHPNFREDRTAQLLKVTEVSSKMDQWIQFYGPLNKVTLVFYLQRKKNSTLTKEEEKK